MDPSSNLSFNAPREPRAVLRLEIEKLSSDGSGIARTDGGVVFVEGALPGESVEAELVRRKKDFSLARTLRVLRPNPGRTTPRCPLFGTCGGCQLQHATYALQLELKADVVRDALRRIGAFEGVEVACAASPAEWGYRNKASFPVKKIKGKPTVGFYRTGSHRLVPLDTCPVNAAPLNRFLEILQRELPLLQMDAYDEREHRGALRHLILRAGRGQTLVSVVVNGRLNAKNMKNLAGLARPLKDATTLTLNHNSRPGNVILGERTEVLKGDGQIEERLNGWTLAYDTSSFFQVNTDQAERLYSYVRELVPEETVGGKVLELYSGVGSLTCYLSGRGAVTAVEEWGGAVDLMNKNLERNGITNVRTLKGRAEEIVGQLEGGYDLVVMDPPRSGCERAVLESVLELRPRNVVYVSCNPSTLARDARILSEGGYKLASVRAFDMFPQTVHVETVVLMTRSAPSS